MTIRLISVEDQRRYRDEVEDYERVMRDRREKGDFMLPFPEFPKPPEPMVDSRDEGCAPSSPFALGSLGTGAPLQDGGIPTRRDLDRDGNSSGTPEGWESEQAKPFKKG